MLILENEKKFISKKINKNNFININKNYEAKKILIMGLPGTGKTYLSKELSKRTNQNLDEKTKTHFL